jgi:hypothetical protein
MNTHTHTHTHTISQRGSSRKTKLAQHTYEEGHRVGWDEARALEIESNPVRTFFPFGSSLSRMRLPTHREDQYVTDSSRFL